MNGDVNSNFQPNEPNGNSNFQPNEPNGNNNFQPNEPNGNSNFQPNGPIGNQNLPNGAWNPNYGQSNIPPVYQQNAMNYAQSGELNSKNTKKGFDKKIYGIIIAGVVLVFLLLFLMFFIITKIVFSPKVMVTKAIKEEYSSSEFFEENFKNSSELTTQETYRFNSTLAATIEDTEYTLDVNGGKNFEKKQLSTDFSFGAEGESLIDGNFYADANNFSIYSPIINEKAFSFPTKTFGKDSQDSSFMELLNVSFDEDVYVDFFEKNEATFSKEEEKILADAYKEVTVEKTGRKDGITNYTVTVPASCAESVIDLINKKLEGSTKNDISEELLSLDGLKEGFEFNVGLDKLGNLSTMDFSDLEIGEESNLDINIKYDDIDTDIYTFSGSENVIVVKVLDLKDQYIVSAVEENSEIGYTFGLKAKKEGKMEGIFYFAYDEEEAEIDFDLNTDFKEKDFSLKCDNFVYKLDGEKTKIPGSFTFDFTNNKPKINKPSDTIDVLSLNEDEIISLAYEVKDNIMASPFYYFMDSDEYMDDTYDEESADASFEEDTEDEVPVSEDGIYTLTDYDDVAFTFKINDVAELSSYSTFISFTLKNDDYVMVKLADDYSSAKADYESDLSYYEDEGYSNIKSDQGVTDTNLNWYSVESQEEYSNGHLYFELSTDVYASIEYGEYAGFASKEEALAWANQNLLILE